ncbi:MAG: YHS domain-containing protein [Thaumarchaeota archaeon]|nr:YHS domain-containing protein [Nitrososphaerota archaeon]
MATDPVCGMTVNESSAKWKADFNGKTYYFCSQGCFGRFTAEPSKFAD